MTVVPTREQAPQIVRGLASPTIHRPAAAASGMTARDLMRLLLKRKWLILISVVSFLAIAFAGTFLWLTYAPLYTAEAYIEVNALRTSSLIGAGSAPQEVMDRLTLQQARLTLRDTVLNQAVADENLLKTSWYQLDPTGAPRRLERDLEVAPVPRTNLVRISMTGRLPRELPEIVNAVAGAAVREGKEVLLADRNDELKKLDEEIKLVDDKLTAQRQSAAAILSIGNVTSLQNRTSALSIEMGTLVPELGRLKSEQARAKEMVDAVAAQVRDGTIQNSSDILQAMDSDGLLRNLKAMEQNYSTELDATKRLGGPSHPKVKKLEGLVKDVREQITKRSDELLKVQITALTSLRQNYYNGVTAQLVKVQDDYSTAESKARDLQANLNNYEALAASIKELESRRQRMEDRKIDLQSLSRFDAPSRLRSAATAPREPSMPRWSVMMPLGLALGLVVGLGLTFLLELVDTSIKSPSDVSRRVDLPLLGMVPHSDDMQEEIADLRTAFTTHPNSLMGEAFRQVRTCLLFSGPAAQRRSLLVTSPLPEDGRTTVTMNLAASIARGGRRVLVVDANFRQPMIRKLYPQCPAQGLSDILVGQARWTDVVHEVENGLFVISSGPLPPNPSELLHSEATRQTLSEMTAQYDQVIFDGSPCLVVTDAAILATQVDGTILVVRAGANTYGIVQRARDTLARVGARIVGVVLNGVRVTAGGYLRKNYETFYEYHQPAELPPK